MEISAILDALFIFQSERCMDLYLDKSILGTYPSLESFQITISCYDQICFSDGSFIIRDEFYHWRAEVPLMPIWFFKTENSIWIFH